MANEARAAAIHNTLSDRLSQLRGVFNSLTSTEMTFAIETDKTFMSTTMVAANGQTT
jgi:hypothetical protein